MNSERAKRDNRPPLTGAVGRTVKLRARPNIGLADDAEAYAKFLYQNIDYLQESYWLDFPEAFISRLEQAKQQASLVRRTGGLVGLLVGPERMQVRGHGDKGGINWVFGHDDFIVLMRRPGTQWNVSVRYLSAGLYEHGVNDLRRRVITMFEAIGEVAKESEGDFERVSRVDYAFDFHSPAFSEAMKDPMIVRQFICHRSSKVNVKYGFDRWGTPEFAETYTVGSKSGCQVQVYDKGREITQISGKDWMVPLWESSGKWRRPDDGRLVDLWRVEARFARKGYFRERNIRTWSQFEKIAPACISEAIFSKRLTTEIASDTNRRRWPLHPLWTRVFEVAGVDDMPPIGRKVTGRRKELVEQSKKQVAGVLLSQGVLEHGVFNLDRARESVLESVEIAAADPHRRRKELAAVERYELVDEAR